MSPTKQSKYINTTKICFQIWVDSYMLLWREKEAFTFGTLVTFLLGFFFVFKFWAEFICKLIVMLFANSSYFFLSLIGGSLSQSWEREGHQAKSIIQNGLLHNLDNVAKCTLCLVYVCKLKSVWYLGEGLTLKVACNLSWDHLSSFCSTGIQ